MSVLPLLIMAAAFSACGREVSESSGLEGRVIDITDGDTVEVELKSGPITVQLDSIDAPERDQPYGQAATVALSQLFARSEIELQVTAQDRRLAAIVYAGGVNINERMVRSGHAWAHGPYVKDHEYCVWERAARDRRKGLWRLPSAQRVAPWEWRGIERGRTSVVTDYTNNALEDSPIAGPVFEDGVLAGDVTRLANSIVVLPLANQQSPGVRVFL